MLLEPSPKFQFQATGLPVDASVKSTTNGTIPSNGLAVKSATRGGGGAVTRIVTLLLLEPPLPVTVNVAV